jgi:amidophosphoribosyltransferase
MGLVQAGFSESELSALTGNAAIGHVRYSTAGASQLKNAQPLAVDYAQGSIALAHNGNLTNHDALRSELELKGSIFQSSSDTETIVHLFARSSEVAPEDRIVDALSKVEGAYSLLLLTEGKLVAVRDPRRLPAARARSHETRRPRGLRLASEPTSFELIGAEFERDVEPGEMLVIDDSGPALLAPLRATPARALSVRVRLLRPARRGARGRRASTRCARSSAGGSRSSTRSREGRRDAIVIPVPDSGVPAAIGYGEGSGLPFEMGLIRSHYVGRTFIEPQDSIRHFGVRLKLTQPRSARGQARGRRRRLDRARHHQPQDRAHAARRRRARGARAHLEPADEVAVLLRHRHAHAQRAHRVDALGREDLRVPRGRLGRLPLARASGERLAQEGLLSRVFLGEYAVPIPRHGAHRLRLVQS